MKLPEDNEPLILADGTKIDPTTGKVIRDVVSQFITVPSPSAAQALIVKTRRSVGELPLPPQQLSGVALVAFYTLFGLPDSEIAVAVDGRLTVDQIKQIKELDAYREFMDSAKDNIVATETNTVRDIFQKNAAAAANKVVTLAESENDVLAFKASQDILDRAGHRPADVVEHRHRMEDALNIVITKRDETQQVPVIEGEIING